MNQKVVTLQYRDIDRHEDRCTCGDCNSNGKSYGFAAIDLSPFGVTHEFQITEEITDELPYQDPLEVFYGPSEESAKDRALTVLTERGWKLPEKKPTYEQLVGALQMLVGEEGEVADKCYCHDGLARNFTMCAFCWSKAAYEAAEYFIHGSIGKGEKS